MTDDAPILDEPKELKGGYTTLDPRLDRLPEFDQRSREYPIRATITRVKPRSYTWRLGHWLDQGKEGRCVEYGICHEMLARPVLVQRSKIDDILAGRKIYWPAQQEDQWPGGSYPGASPFYEGTSVLSGMKVAARLGFFKEYRWAFGIEDLVLAIGYKGPAVLGINWYQGQYNTDANGFIAPTGRVMGGHALAAAAVRVVWQSRTRQTFDDIDQDRSYVTLHNSWGQDWGQSGRAKITVRNLDRLLREQGEAAVPVLRAA